MEKNGFSTSLSLENMRFRQQNSVSDVKYYFPLENLVFGVETCIFHTKRYFPLEKNWISLRFSLENMRFRQQNSVSDVKYCFPRETLVFGVKTGIFLTKRYFPLEKNLDFHKIFSTKIEVSTVKLCFRCKIIFCPGKPRFRC